MTSLGLLFVLGWVGGIAVTAAGLHTRRWALVLAGALIFASTVVIWTVVVQA